MDEGVRLIQTGNVGIGEYREKGFRYISPQTFGELRCTAVEPGDVLICRLDGPVGRACLAPDLGVPMITSVDNAILKASTDHDPRFVVYSLSSQRYIDWVGVLCRVGGGHRFRISRTILGEIRVAVPPIREQERIANLLDEHVRVTRRVEDKLSTQLVRLREYRQSLISAAVTGQLEIPVPPPEPTP